MKWETIEEEKKQKKLERAQVPGGWLVRQWVRSTALISDPVGATIAFVPDPEHTWKL